MKVNIILFLFLGSCCVKIGNADSTHQCSAAVTAFPPDPKTGCCGHEVFDGSKILSGRVTAIDQYPWLALIEYKSEEGDDKLVPCGGALISGKYVLTTGHCVANHYAKEKVPTNIRLGEYNKDNEGPDCDGGDCTSGAIRIPIEKIIPHPEHNQRNNDIALIRMQQTAPYTDFIRPICLPTMDVTIQEGPIYFTLASWTTPDGPSPVKVYVNLPFVTKDECSKQYEFNHQFTSWKGLLCAGGEKDRDACKGDSGLPLMYQKHNTFEVIGLVNFGIGECGVENIPSVYTNVYEHRSWITSNIVP